jgi:hypothetical protein
MNSSKFLTVRGHITKGRTGAVYLKAQRRISMMQGNGIIVQMSYKRWYVKGSR